MDSKLKGLVPITVEAYLHCLKNPSNTAASSSFLPILQAISKVVCAFCEVRGYKIISQFFRSEPYLIRLLLERLRHITSIKVCDDWEERYFLIIWLSHLLLIPFSLDSMGNGLDTFQGSMSSPPYPQLPEKTPLIVVYLVDLFSKILQSPARERESAALALARLSLRPDMISMNLSQKLVTAALFSLAKNCHSSTHIFRNLGDIQFLERLVTSADSQNTPSNIADIYPTLVKLFSGESTTSLCESAVARKSFVKIIRISAIYLSRNISYAGEGARITIEEMIDYLFQSLMDRDSPVRYAAAKSVSILVKYLEPILAVEVTESVFLTADESLLNDNKRNRYVLMNPSKCHGYTLALSYLIFQRSVTHSQIPDVVHHLLFALNFHQPSSTGLMIGAVVRDAACFGLWSFARHYSYQQHILSKSISFRIGTSDFPKILQNIAIELLNVSCLDPVGNIRRGASAALQELIGRNPDTVDKGISLIQIADYHSVGLRDRAVGQVAVQIAGLSQVYWDAILSGLLDWRCILSADVSARNIAALAIGRISLLTSRDAALYLLEQMLQNLCATSPNAIEQFHGTSLAILYILKERLGVEGNESPTLSDEILHEANDYHEKFARYQSSILALLEKVKPSGQYFGLFGIAICAIIRSWAEVDNILVELQSTLSTALLNSKKKVWHVLYGYLDCYETSFLEMLSETCGRLFQVIAVDELEDFGERCLQQLQEAPYRSGRRSSARLIILGILLVSVRTYSDIFDSVLEEFSVRCTSDFDICNRVVTLKATRQLVEKVTPESSISTGRVKKIANIILTGLNDYTIDERGDVGSLVRLEALYTLQEISKWKEITGCNIKRCLEAALVRVSAERMDKVRTEAARCLVVWKRASFIQYVRLR